MTRVLMASAVSLALLGPAEATTSGSPRHEAVDTIIVHAISGPTCARGRLEFSGAPGDGERWKAFFDRHPFLGIHYVVDREGVALVRSSRLPLSARPFCDPDPVPRPSPADARRSTPSAP